MKRRRNNIISPFQHEPTAPGNLAKSLSKSGFNWQNCSHTLTHSCVWAPNPSGVWCVCYVHVWAKPFRGLVCARVPNPSGVWCVHVCGNKPLQGVYFSASSRREGWPSLVCVWAKPFRGLVCVLRVWAPNPSGVWSRANLFRSRARGSYS